jgi:hypothetical protein
LCMREKIAAKGRVCKMHRHTVYSASHAYQASDVMSYLRIQRDKFGACTLKACAYALTRERGKSGWQDLTHVLCGRVRAVREQIHGHQVVLE